MMWTDRAFEIWMGDAGTDAARSADDVASMDVPAFERTLVSRDARDEVTVAPRAGVVTRAIAAFADRTQLSRIARG